MVYLEMMFVFVTEWGVLDARRGGRRERGARAVAEVPDACGYDSYTSWSALPPRPAPPLLSELDAVTVALGRRSDGGAAGAGLACAGAEGRAVGSACRRCGRVLVLPWAASGSAAMASRARRRDLCFSPIIDLVVSWLCLSVWKRGS